MNDARSVRNVWRIEKERRTDLKEMEELGCGDYSLETCRLRRALLQKHISNANIGHFERVPST